MSNVSWGVKRSCPKCAARFYDLNQLPAICPKCNASFDPAAMLKPRRGRSRKFSNVTTEADTDESVITNIMNKATASKKAGAMEGMKGGDALEDSEEIEDFETIDEIESIDGSETKGDDGDEDVIMEEFGVKGSELVDDVDEDEVEEVEEEDAEDAPPPRRRR